MEDSFDPSGVSIWVAAGRVYAARRASGAESVRRQRSYSCHMYAMHFIFYSILLLPSSGVTSHRQPRQCRGAQGPKTVKGAKSDPNYVSRLLLDCVPVFRKIVTPAYLLYRS